VASKVINLEEYLMSIPEETYHEHIPVASKSYEKPMESAELNKLFEALAKAQLEMEVAKTDSTNPYFKSKYADLRSVVDASRPFLAKNGLCVVQRTIPGNNGTSYLYTRLGHLSGQWMESYMPINPPKQDIQTLGSYMTYLRRYSYSSMVGVVAGDEDDDGESAMKPTRQEGVERDTISKPQLDMLAQELKGEPKIVEQIFKSYGISKLSDIPATRYTKCLETIRQIKQAREAREA